MSLTLSDGTVICAHFFAFQLQQFSAYSVPESYAQSPAGVNHERYAPLSPNIIDYQNILIQLSHIIFRLRGTDLPYYISDLYITEAAHIKSDTGFNHEFVQLRVDIRNQDHSFFLKLERTLQHTSVADLPEEGRRNFNACLAAYDRKAKLSWLKKLQSRLFHRRTPTQTTSAKVLELSTAPSSSLYTGPASDTQVSIVTSSLDHLDPHDHILERVYFSNWSLPLLEGISIAASISKHFSIYSPFQQQCYFFSNSIFRCFKKEAASHIRAFGPQERVDRLVERVEIGPGRMLGLRCGKVFRFIDIYRYQQAAFEDVVCKNWGVDRDDLNRRVAAAVETLG